MSRGNLLDAHTTNDRGTELSWDYDGQVARLRRVWVVPSSTMGGATVSVDIRQIGDTEWKPTGISFTAADDAPELLSVQPNDEISAIASGGSGASITIGIA